jgi:hypothetical protein
MDANQLVASVLAKQRKDNEKYKPTAVEKHLEINLGKFLVSTPPICLEIRNNNL